MPPHCDSLDGPVVTAARRALEAGMPDIVLAYVPAAAEAEVRATFDEVLAVRRHPDARGLADHHLFETVVRLHRAGEGAPYTGLKPAGLAVDPVIGIAERAIETGSGDELVAFLCGVVEEQVRDQLAEVETLRARADGDLGARRAAVSAALGLQVWSHKLHACALAAHDHEAHHLGG